MPMMKRRGAATTEAEARANQAENDALNALRIADQNASVAKYITRNNALNDMAREAPTLYYNASQVTHDASILELINQHRALFGDVYRLTDYVYSRFSKAVKMHDKLTEDSVGVVFVHFQDIHIYALFTFDSYVKLIDRLHARRQDKLIDSETPDDMHVREIVLSDASQKFVFICSKPQSFDTVREHVKKCFGDVDVSTFGDRVFVDIKLPNVHAARSAYEKLIASMKNVPNAAGHVKSVEFPTEERKCKVPYTSSDGPTWQVTAPRPAGLSSEEIMAWVTATIAANPGGPININIVNIGTNNGGVNNFNPAPVIKTSKDIMNDRAMAWIDSNPPGDNELASAYHDRYKAIGGRCLSKNAFGKVTAKHLAESFTKPRNADGKVCYRAITPAK